MGATDSNVRTSHARIPTLSDWRWVREGYLLQMRLLTTTDPCVRKSLDDFIECSVHDRPRIIPQNPMYEYHCYQVLQTFKTAYEALYGACPPHEYLVGAYLHDIGKFNQPDLFTSDKKFSTVELERAKLHTTDGYDMLVSRYSSPSIPYMALLHHERLDRTGYPFGFQIPSSQYSLLAAVDPHVAIMEHRSYRMGFHSIESEWALVSKGLLQEDSDAVRSVLEECLVI